MAVVDKARSELRPRRLILGGRSMGGRTASMLAAEGFEAEGLLLLAYPLHPAGQPELFIGFGVAEATRGTANAWHFRVATLATN